MSKHAIQTSRHPVVPPPETADAIGALTAACQALLAVAQGLNPDLRHPVVPSLSHAPRSQELSLKTLVDEFLASKARTQRSDRYLRQLRTILKRFQHGQAKRPAASVTVQDIERWLSAQDWSARTRYGACQDLRTLFGWGVKRGLLARNPALGVELQPHRSLEPIHVHSPAEVRQVLEEARRLDLQVCRLLAVRYFAGVRSAEASRLRETDIKGGWIEVPAAKSKTRSRRLVKIRPCLEAWLSLGGTLGPMRTDRVRQVVLRSGVRWSHNVTRHTFASYHLAAFRQSSETALEAGHSEEILFRHYRELVSSEAAAQFWEVVPSAELRP